MKRLFAASALLAMFAHAAVAGEITLFADGDFRGGRVTLQREARDLNAAGFNDRASSVIVRSGIWQLCQHRDFGGQCVEVGPGEYPSLPNFNDAVSSAREVSAGGRWRDRDGYRDNARDNERDDWHEGQRDEWRERKHEGRQDERRGWRGGDAVQLFADAGFRGERVVAGGEVRSLERLGFNDRAGSLIIREGRWEFCEHADFRGECVILGPGDYPSLDRMNHRFSSMRRVR